MMFLIFPISNSLGHDKVNITIGAGSFENDDRRGILVLKILAGSPITVSIAPSLTKPYEWPLSARTTEERPMR